MKLKDSYATYLFGEDEAVLVSAQRDEFAGFLRGNATAAFIIEQLRHETSKEEIVQRMAEQFDAPVSVLERDVAAVVGELAAIGALEGSDIESERASGARDRIDGALMGVDDASSQIGGESDQAGGALFGAVEGPALVNGVSDDAHAWTFEDELRERGTFVYRNVGVSMRPLIKQGRDLVVVGTKPAGRCQKYDVVLYRRGARYILHRIVEVRPDGYIICGDNCMNKEYDIADGDIVGVMKAVVRNGVEINASNPRYQRYARLWCAAYPVRRVAMKARSLAGRLVRKLRGA